MPAGKLQPWSPWLVSTATFGVLPLAVATACVSAAVMTINAGSNKNLNAFFTAQVALCDFLIACGPMIIFYAMVTGKMDTEPSENNLGCLTATVFSYTTTDISACMLPLYVVAAYHHIYYINVSWYQAQISKSKLQLGSHLIFLVLLVVNMYLLDSSTSVDDHVCTSFMLLGSMHGHTGFILFNLVLVWLGVLACAYPIARNSHLTFYWLVRHFQHPGRSDSEFACLVKHRPQAFDVQKYMKVPLRFHRLKLDDIMEEDSTEANTLALKKEISMTEMERVWPHNLELRHADYYHGAWLGGKEEEIRRRSSAKDKEGFDIQLPKQEHRKWKRSWWSSAAESHRMLLSSFLETSSPSKNSLMEEKSSDNPDSGQNRPTFLINLLDTSEGRSKVDGLTQTSPSRRHMGSNLNPDSWHDLNSVLETSMDEDTAAHRSVLTSPVSRTASQITRPISNTGLQHAIEIKRSSSLSLSQERDGAGRQKTPTGRKGEYREEEGETDRLSARRDGLDAASTSTFSSFEMRFLSREALWNQRSVATGQSMPVVQLHTAAEEEPHSGGSADRAADERRGSLSRTLSDSGLRSAALQGSLRDRKDGRRHHQTKGAVVDGVPGGPGSLEPPASPSGSDLALSSGRNSRSTQTNLRDMGLLDHRAATAGSCSSGKSSISAKRGKSSGGAGGGALVETGKVDGAMDETKTKDDTGRDAGAYAQAVHEPDVTTPGSVGMKRQHVIASSHGSAIPRQQRGVADDSQLAFVRPGGIPGDIPSLFKDDLTMPELGLRRGRKWKPGKVPVDMIVVGGGGPSSPTSPTTSIRNSSDSERRPIGEGGARPRVEPVSCLEGVTSSSTNPTSSPWELIRQMRRERHARLLAQLHKVPSTRSTAESPLGEDVESGSAAAKKDDIVASKLDRRLNLPRGNHSEGRATESSDVSAGSGEGGWGDKGAQKSSKSSAKKSSSGGSFGLGGDAGDSHGLGCFSSVISLAHPSTKQTVNERGRAAFWRLALFTSVHTTLWLPVLVLLQVNGTEGVPLQLRPAHLSLCLLAWLRPLVGSALLLWFTLTEC